VHELVQRLGLGESAGISVEQKTAATTQTSGAFADHIGDGGVWNERATTHVFECGGHGGGWSAVGPRGGGAENISGGKMTGAETLVKEFGLRALADSRCAEENEAPARVSVGGTRGAIGRRTLKPGGAVVVRRGHEEPHRGAKAFWKAGQEGAASGRELIS